MSARCAEGSVGGHRPHVCFIEETTSWTISNPPLLLRAWPGFLSLLLLLL